MWKIAWRAISLSGGFAENANNESKSQVDKGQGGAYFRNFKYMFSLQ